MFLFPKSHSQFIRNNGGLTPGGSSLAICEPLFDDATGNLLTDDATGEVLLDCTSTATTVVAASFFKSGAFSAVGSGSGNSYMPSGW